MGKDETTIEAVYTEVSVGANVPALPGRIEHEEGWVATVDHNPNAEPTPDPNLARQGVAALIKTSGLDLVAKPRGGVLA